MTDVKHYLVGEHVEDFNSGLISRRELLRRVTLITGSIASTLVFLEVAGLVRAVDAHDYIERVRLRDWLDRHLATARD